MDFFKKFFVKQSVGDSSKDVISKDDNEKKVVSDEKSMQDNVIITIAREFGSGGREVAQKLAQKLNYRFSDKEDIVKTAKENGIDTELFEQVDQKNMDSFWFTVSPMAYDIQVDSDSFEQKVNNDKMFMIQSDTIREIASKDNVVFVGRCASYILRSVAKKIFIMANMDDKVKRIMKRYKLSKNEAEKLIDTADKKREKYYDYYTNTKWNDKSNYDLVINVSDTGIDGAVDKIIEFLNKK